MKKFLLAIALLAMCVSVAHASRTDISCSGTVTITASNAAWVGGHGWSSGSTRTISWSASCNMCQFGPAIYGWGTNPLVEYYIGRSGGSSAGSYSTSKGTFTLYTNSCNGPNITGSGSFSQYNCSGNGGSGQNMGEHSSGWSRLGKGTNMGGGYQIVAGENYGGGTGTFTASVSGANWGTVWWGSGSASISCGGGGSTTTTSSSSTTTTSYTSTSTSSSGGNTIVVRARGTAGSESINLKVGGSTIATWTLSTSMTNRSASTNNTGGVDVQFTNDASGRDVQVDYVVVNGSTRQAENQSYNTGVWQNSSCGGSYSEWLHCNGTIGFGDVSGGGGTTTTSASSTSTTTTSYTSTSTSSSGGTTIVVRARGTAGSESINLKVNNSTIATWTLSTSMVNRSASTSSSGGIDVQFTNDASGRDVQVDYIVVNGSTRQAENQSYNTGVWQNSSCGGSYSEWLHCNGTIGFGNTP